MSEIKIVFVDIDHTLFDHEIKDFTKSAIETLRLVRKKGIKVVIASSRPYSSLKYLGAIDKVPHDGYICVNGGLVFLENEYIVKNIIPSKDIFEIEQKCNDNNVLLQIVPLTDVFQNRNVNEYFLTFKNKWGQPTPRIKKYEREEVSSLILFGDEIVESLFGDIKDLYFFNFCPGGYDIYKKKYSKGDGIKAVLNYYGFNKDEAMALGDDLNDIEMFNCVKYSVCMGNGRDEVKKVSLFVTDKIGNDGVKKAFEHYNVI